MSITFTPAQVDAILRDAAGRMSSVVDGFAKIFGGGVDESVWNGSENLPTLAKLIGQLQSALYPVRDVLAGVYAIYPSSTGAGGALADLSNIPADRYVVIREDELAPDPYTGKPTLYRKSDGILVYQGAVEKIREDLLIDGAGFGADVVANAVRRAPTPEAMRAHSSPTDKQIFQISESYSSSGDTDQVNDSPRYVWVAGSDAQVDGELVLDSTVGQDGRFHRLTTSAEYSGYKAGVGFPSISLASKIRQAGLNPIDVVSSKADRTEMSANPNNLVAVGSAVQEASDYMNSLGGGVVRFNTRYNISAELVVKPNLTFRGEASAYSNKPMGRITTPAGGANITVLTNDRTVGEVRGVGDDGEPQRAWNFKAENMAFFSTGNAFSRQRRAMRVINAWEAEFLNCRFAGFGHAVEMIDCNLMKFLGGFASGGMFWDSVADSSICGGMELGPANFPAVDGDRQNTVLWLSGIGCWKNQFANLFAYNCPNGVAQTAVFTSGSQLITVTGHDFIDETPVTIETTGNAPTGFLALTGTYLVKVIDADTIKLASSRPNLLAGTFVTPSSSGTGTQSLRVGGRGNLFMNNKAKWNGVIGGRFDQSYWSGIFLADANYNVISGTTIHENGRANATGQNGLRLLLTTGNCISGNVIDGTATATATGASNQTVGIGAGSQSNDEIGTNTVRNHSAGNYVQASDSTSRFAAKKTVVATRDDWNVREGAPSLVLLTGNRRAAWAFDPTSKESLQKNLEFPPGYTHWTVKLHWSNLGAGSGSVKWLLQYEEDAIGADFSDNEDGSLTLASVALAQDLANVVVGSFTLSGLGGACSVTIARDSLDGSDDTLPNDAGLLFVVFEALE